MNDDLIVQKILKLLENNTAFIGHALNGGIGTKINVKNTETGKTLQALSINVDSSGEVLVVKDDEDGKYKAVTFKAAEQVTERIIQLRKTKPVDDKKIIDYTDSDIEVFYLFIKLIDTGSPVNTQLQSTWIRKGSSCTQFVGAYERCNYASKETIGGISYTGLPYKPYSTLTDCLNDDLGRDAKTPHGSGDENSGINPGWKIYSTKMTALAEEDMKNALESHDAYYHTSYKKLFGYASILECGGAMYLQGWEHTYTSPTDGSPSQYVARCEFSYLPGYTNDCTLEMRNAGYCDNRGFISSKTPPPGTPGVGSIDNSWAYEYGWIDLPYEFMYKRHFPYNYLQGQNAQGSFLILEVNEDQTPTIPEGFYPWIPGCPSNLGDGGPYDGGGGNRNPDGPPKPKKRDMKLSTHKAEIWLGSNKKKEAIKLYELGASDLFSGMYNSFIIKANETQVDALNRTRSNTSPTLTEIFSHETFYKNWNKNIIDLKIDPRVWIYIIDNKPAADYQGGFHDLINPDNTSFQVFVDNLYNRTINLSILDTKTQIVHLKLGLTPKNQLSNTDCKGTNQGKEKANDSFSTQSWEHQKFVTIKVKDWKIISTSNVLDTSDLDSNESWNKGHIERKFLTSFGSCNSILARDIPSKLLSRPNSSSNITELLSGNHYEQFNYSVKKLLTTNYGVFTRILYIDNLSILKKTVATDAYRNVGLGTVAWWELWNKTVYNKKSKRLSSIVGFDQNTYQIVKTANLGRNLDYSGYDTGSYNGLYAVSQESYYDYLPNRPLQYITSIIKAIRDKIISGESYNNIEDRKKFLDNYGLLFYFSDFDSKWTWSRDFLFLPIENNQNNYYYDSSSDRELYSTNRYFGDTDTRLYYSITTRLDTRRWINRLWAQLVYEEFVKIDVDSYKNVEFNLPTNSSQYIKYADYYLYANSDYPFAVQPQATTELETVLTPGVLDVTKQVKIMKPTNVELDPNYSFLLYIFPYVTVTKKTKEI